MHGVFSTPSHYDEHFNDIDGVSSVKFTALQTIFASDILEHTRKHWKGFLLVSGKNQTKPYMWVWKVLLLFKLSIPTSKVGSAFDLAVHIIHSDAWLHWPEDEQHASEVIKYWGRLISEAAECGSWQISNSWSVVGIKPLSPGKSFKMSCSTIYNYNLLLQSFPSHIIVSISIIFVDPMKSPDRTSFWF